MIKFLSKKQTKELVGLSFTHMKRLEDVGQFPQSVKLGTHVNSRVMYVEEEVQDWMTARVAEREQKPNSSTS